jgi:hypothetical protein
LHVAFWAVAGALREVIPRLAAQVVSQKQAAHRMLDAPAHLHHVFHDLFHRCALNAHVDGSNGDHKVEAGHDVASILDEFVEVGEMVVGMRVA